MALQGGQLEIDWLYQFLFILIIEKLQGITLIYHVHTNVALRTQNGLNLWNEKYRMLIKKTGNHVVR